MNSAAQKTLLIIIVLILIIVGVVVVQSRMQPNGSNTPPVDQNPEPVSTEGTLQGTLVCLPHKNTEGPQTLECAFGIQTASTTYYGLDTQDVHSEDGVLQMTGSQVKVTGTIVPVEALNSDFWQRYNIKGIMRVKTYEKVTTNPPPVLVNSKVTLGLNESITVNKTTVTPWAVTEDSRCASDVVCIQAGRAVVAFKLVSSPSSSIMELQEGRTATAEGLSITLDKVTPYPISTHKTADSEYRFALTIKNK